MNYKLSKEDDNDLIDLYLHGFKNFGESQAEQYYFEIEDCIKLLSETPLTCRERTEFTPAVRIHHHGSHLIIYRRKKRPGQLITAETLHLHRRMKALFKQSRNSLGSREMMKKLREEGIETGRYKVRKLMKILKLKVTQRIAYKVTTKRNHNDDVADNLLNQNFNPVAPNQVWAGDIAYLKTGEGWMYLAIVMDLYSRRIAGWSISKRMTTDLICKAMVMAYNIRQPPFGLVFHSDRGSQYTSKRYRKLLSHYGIRASMGDVGACWDNAVVERFFGSLKHDWIFKIAQPTREHMKKDVAVYMRYYNLERLHSANGEQSPINYENSLKKMSGWT